MVLQSHFMQSNLKVEIVNYHSVNTFVFNCVEKVGELESQIDSFEAEIEGLSFRKGKGRPPRLVGEKKKHTNRKCWGFQHTLTLFLCSGRPI